MKYILKTWEDQPNLESELIEINRHQWYWPNTEVTGFVALTSEPSLKISGKHDNTKKIL